MQICKVIYLVALAFILVLQLAISAPKTDAGKLSEAITDVAASNTMTSNASAAASWFFVVCLEPDP